MQNISLELAWYEKEGDQFLVSVMLVGINLSELNNLFNLSPEDPMPYIYPVKEIHVSFLQKFLNVEIDLKKYDYFIEDVT
ncbi:DUF7683 domain-containing protein [Crocosphaera sp. Alani8]|uniref:DUF7683 domain-containing protein n=1 Tax=Crocosphaera sp. Alani8 TaxID=3038952 RepID=UPI00313C81DF